MALSPNRLGALFSLGGALVRESKLNEAAQYLNHAVETEPTSWRAHAVLAEAYLRQGLLEEATHQAERALELGHVQAGIVQPLLARALDLRGHSERAIQVLQAYLKENALDAVARKQLENLQSPFASSNEASRAAVLASPPEPTLPTSLLLPSNWLPPDIDEGFRPWNPALPVICKRSSKSPAIASGNSLPMWTDSRQRRR